MKRKMSSSVRSSTSFHFRPVTKSARESARPIDPVDSPAYFHGLKKEKCVQRAYFVLRKLVK